MIKVVAFFITTVVFLGAIFVGVVWFLFSNEEDQSYLTQRIQATEVDSQWSGDQYVVVYSYEGNGQTYYGEDRMYRRNWRPGDALSVCVDPNDVARHALAFRDCGSSDVGTSTKDGVTTIPQAD